jgi:flagellin
MNSVNTNYGAMVALQNLNSTGKDLSQVQSRINTGLKVANAKDNGAVFAIAEGMRARSLSLGAVQDGISSQQTIMDTAMSAGNSIGEILKQMKAKAVAAQATSDTTQKANLQNDFNALRAQIDQIANSATVNGVNLVNGGNSSGITVMTSDKGGAGGLTAGYAGNGGNALGELSPSQSIMGSQTIGAAAVIGFDPDEDFVTFTLLGPGTASDPGAPGAAGGGDDRTFVVSFETGDTIQSFINRVNTTTGGAVQASWDAENGRVVYAAAEAFTAVLTDGATTNAAASLENMFQFTGTANAFVAGGGYQTTGDRAAAGTTTASLLSSIETTLATTDALTFTVGTGGSTRVYSVNLSNTANYTLGDFLAAVSAETGGAVTASFDASTRRVTYRSNETFTMANTTVTSTVLAPTTTTAFSTPAGSAASSGGAQINVSGYDLRVGRGALTAVTNALDLSTDAAGASAAIDTAMASLNNSMARLGSQSKALDVQNDFLAKLQDNIDKGLGIMVDADLAKESARLQALQIKQQLGAQALSIANQQPQILLSFFR